MDSSFFGAEESTDDIRGQLAHQLEGQINEAHSSVSFPYAGIFSPGGFLSHVSYNDNLKASLDDDVSASVSRITLSENVNDEEIVQASPMEMGSREHPVYVTQGPGPGKPNASDLPPVESALSIDNVLDHILGCLKAPDLLHCRLVSRRWLLFSQKPLQKLLTLSFDGKFLRSKGYKKESGEKIKTINKLSCFFQTSKGFPCVKFVFNGISIMHSDLQNFLDSHGLLVEELTLTPEKNQCSLPHEREIMLHVRRLLTVQAPNLRILSIEISCDVTWINNEGRRKDDMLKPDDPELMKILEECKSLKSSNLKVVHMLKPWNAKVMETIIQLASNLKEIRCSDFDFEHIAPCFLKVCTLNAKNRIQLLKNLSVDARTVGICEEILDICQTVGVNLQLRELVVVEINGENQVKPRLAKVINRIFEMCWNSLEIILWYGVSNLRAIKFPEVMPKVQVLYFSYPWLRIFDSLNLKFSPGSSFSTIFQNVRFITATSESSTDFTNFLMSVYGRPMPGVKSVRLIFTNAKMQSNSLQIISVLFPNAKVS